MEITKEMIEAYAKRFSIDLTDGSQEPGILGTLQGWAVGEGVLDAELVNGNPLFEEVAKGYFAAKGVEVPESVEVPLTPVDEGATDIMEEVPEVVEDEKLPEAGEVTE